MTRTSHRHTATPSDRAAVEEPSARWTIIGGGRLGRGVLAPLAYELGMSSLLVVAGENTSREEIERYNTQGSYNITLNQPPGLKLVSNYKFFARAEIDVIVESIADLRTRVVSTSVGEDRLPEVLPILAAGLRERAVRGGSDARTTGLLLLICENGRGPDGKPRAVSVRAALEEMLLPHSLDELAHVPIVVLDAIIPTLGDSEVKVCRGDIWIEDTDLTRELFDESSSVRLVSDEDIATVHTRKLYCVNTLHLLLSVAGAFAGEETLDRIATDPNLQRHWSAISRSLAAATCEPQGLSAEHSLAGVSTAQYARAALDRLQRPPWAGFDNVERAMAKLRRGWYMDDGRIDGPVVDAGLIENPDRHPELVHAIAIALYSVVGSITGLAQRFAFVPSDSSALIGRESLRTAFAPGLALAAGSPFTAGSQSSPLVEALARDFQELHMIRPGGWTPRLVADFLARPISTQLRALPRRAGRIKCVMFDLDEGLVATESLLFRVTQELIATRSHNGSSLTHDEYAGHVGRPEEEFFRTMTQAFQLKLTADEDLVHLREERFLAALSQVYPETLVKPGFRALLAFLAEKRVVMAVCSNGSERRVKATLDRAGIKNYFADVLTPGNGCVPKGSTQGPSMYDVLRQRLEEEIEDCVVVESSLFGVSAAVEAGLYTLLVVNDYTEPKRVRRPGVHVIGNAQMLQTWFTEHWTATTTTRRSRASAS